MDSEISNARSFLFVPGNRPERFAKAVATGADVVILDLEDAVGTADKQPAREHVAAFLRTHAKAIVRVNAFGTHEFSADAEALAGVAPTVMLPKSETPDQVESAAEAFQARVIPLLETPSGILAAQQIAAAPSAHRLAFGNVDLSTELGVDPENRDALVAARSVLTLASAAAGLPGPIDGVTVSLGDDEAVAADAQYAAHMGFTGKLCIHPRQVDSVNRAFSPSDELIQWAKRVLGAEADGHARSIDGSMIDRPVVERARRLLARAGVSH